MLISKHSGEMPARSSPRGGIAGEVEGVELGPSGADFSAAVGALGTSPPFNAFRERTLGGAMT